MTWFFDPLQPATAAFGVANVKISFAEFQVPENAQTAVPNGVARTPDLGSPTVVAAVITSSPSSVASAAAVGTPGVASPVIADVTTTGVDSTAAVGTPSAASTVGVVATGVSSVAAIGEPSATIAVTIAATGVDSAAAVGTPAATSTVGVSATGVDSAVAVGTPDAASTVGAAATGVDSAAAVGTPDVASTVGVATTSVDSTAAVGTPAAASTIGIAATSVDSATAVGTPSVASTVGVAATGVDSAAAVGQPIVSEGSPPAVVETSSVERTPSVGSPSVTWLHSLDATGVTSASAVGVPFVTEQSVVAADATGVASTAAIGLPKVDVVVYAGPSGVPGSSAVGIPALDTDVLSADLSWGGLLVSQAVNGGTPTALIAPTVTVSHGSGSVHDVSADVAWAELESLYPGVNVGADLAWATVLTGATAYTGATTPAVTSSGYGWVTGGESVHGELAYATLGVYWSLFDVAWTELAIAEQFVSPIIDVASVGIVLPPPRRIFVPSSITIKSVRYPIIHVGVSYYARVAQSDVVRIEPVGIPHTPTVSAPSLYVPVPVTGTGIRAELDWAGMRVDQTAIGNAAAVLNDATAVATGAVYDIDAHLGWAEIASLQTGENIELDVSWLELVTSGGAYIGAVTPAVTSTGYGWASGGVAVQADMSFGDLIVDRLSPTVPVSVTHEPAVGVPVVVTYTEPVITEPPAVTQQVVVVGNVIYPAAFTRAAQPRIAVTASVSSARTQEITATARLTA
jgi:hypothetical protein